MMRRGSSLALVTALLALASASPRHHEWVRTGVTLADHDTVTVIFAVRHGVSFDALQDECQSVSDPASPRYGQYLSLPQLTSAIAAAAHTDAVTSWASAVGGRVVASVATNDFVVAALPVAAVVTHLSTAPLELFAHPSHGATIPRSLQPYTLPPALQPHVDVVLGVSDFPPLTDAPRRGRHAAAQSSPLVRYDDDDGLPTVVIAEGAIDDTHAHLYVEGADTLAAATQWVAQVAVDGAAPTNYTVPLSAVQPQQGLTLVTLNASQGMQGAFHRYDVRFFITTATGGVQHAHFGLQQSAWKPFGNGLAATPAITPEVLRDFYNTSNVDVSTHADGNSQAVAEFGKQFYSPDALAAYLKRFNVTTAASVSAHGPNNATAPGVEAAMDIELLMALAPNVDTTFWSVGMTNPSLNGSFVLEWAMQMTNDSSPPLVTSMSYGLPEYLIPEYFDAVYYRRTNVELVKLCTRGVTVVVCSQDAGYSDKGHGADSCAANPVFPSSSPWVTAVSATMAARGNGVAPRPGRTDGVGEVAVSIPNGCYWTTGSGFSDEPTSRRPQWQNAAVTQYLKSGVAFPSTFNTTGRAYPDLSALGRNYPIVVGGGGEDGVVDWTGDGTSSSTPVVSGLLSLINSARLAAGKPALGFFNPLLYTLAAKDPTLFYDVTQGETSCGAFLCCTDTGYAATRGYDAVTGLGTVGDFEGLVKAAVAAAP